MMGLLALRVTEINFDHRLLCYCRLPPDLSGVSPMEAFFRRRKDMAMTLLGDVAEAAANDDDDEVFLPNRCAANQQQHRRPSNRVKNETINFRMLQPSCDIQLLTSDRVQLFAHLHLLAAASDGFKKLLRQREQSEKRQCKSERHARAWKVVYVDELGVDVEELLQYLYFPHREIPGEFSFLFQKA